MARGQEVKNNIINKILEVFPGSFLNDKEIRICGIEDGEEVQIKVTLTAAKVNIDNTNGAIAFSNLSVESSSKEDTQNEIKQVEISDMEKSNIEDLLASLGL